MTVYSPIQREIHMNVSDFNNIDCFILMLKLPTDKPCYLDQYKIHPPQLPQLLQADPYN